MNTRPIASYYTLIKDRYDDLSPLIAGGWNPQILLQFSCTSIEIAEEEEETVCQLNSFREITLG